MSVGEGSGSDIGLETIRARNWPTITQFSVFLENRVGQLLEVVRAFHGSKVKIVGLSISDSADCCILRLILSHPEQGREILETRRAGVCRGTNYSQPNCPSGPQSLVDLCTALLRAEINIHYAYPLIVHPHGRAAVALHIDNVEQASQTLHCNGIRDPQRGGSVVTLTDFVSRRFA